MIWIENRKDNIPKKLCYSNYELDKDEDGHTPLMLWIIHRESDIPK